MNVATRINNYNCKKPIILNNANFDARENVKKVNFNGYQNVDKLVAKKLNYIRIGSLISQSVPDEKISKIFDGYLDFCAGTVMPKIFVSFFKGFNKLAELVNPKAIIGKKSEGLAVIVSKTIPDSLKVERLNDDLFDLPKEVTESVVYILKTVDNFSDFVRVSHAYGAHMSRLGYTKNSSDLPVVNGYGIMDNLLVLNYNKPLKTN